MRLHRKHLFLALLLAAAPATVLAQDSAPVPAPAPPPPSMDDPGQPASTPIKPDDPRLAPLPPESAPETPAKKPAANDHAKSDGDPTNLPALPTDDAFHPPPKTPDEKQSADGYSVHSYTTAHGDHIQEFRHGGQLTEVRVKPANGPAFELRDTNGDGRIDHNDATNNQVVPVQWSLFEWH
jgi:hypothetical protein